MFDVCVCVLWEGLVFSVGQPSMQSKLENIPRCIGKIKQIIDYLIMYNENGTVTTYSIGKNNANAICDTHTYRHISLIIIVAFFDIVTSVYHH